LVTPDLDKEIRVKANISNFVIEGVLLMKCEDKRWRLVAYILKLLNEAKKNYEIHNKEILMIIRCLEAWRYFLEDIKSQFKLRVLYESLEVKSKAD